MVFSFSLGVNSTNEEQLIYPRSAPVWPKTIVKGLPRDAREKNSRKKENKKDKPKKGERICKKEFVLLCVGVCASEGKWK